MSAPADLNVYPQGRPSPQHEAALGRATARARRVEPSLPAFRIAWHAAPGCPRFGQTDFTGAGRVVRLRADLPAKVIESVALHEIGHVAAGPSEEAADLFVLRVHHEDSVRYLRRIDPGRQALVSEGRALADRAERERRGFTPAERRRADEILADVRRPTTAAPAPAPRCSRCGCGTDAVTAHLRKCRRCGDLIRLP